MPIPDDVTQEELAEWDRSYEDQFEENVGFPLAEADDDSWSLFRELFRSGEWLVSRMRTLGADDDTCRKVSYSFGQMCFGTPDMWDVAKGVLERFREDGSYEKPGDDLARRLLEDSGLIDG